MSALLRTESDVMVATAAKVDDTNSQVQSELSRLEGVVDGIRGSWAGQAQASFDSLMARWNDSARRLQGALEAIAENIRSNARHFDDVEAANAQALGAVAGLDL